MSFLREIRNQSRTTREIMFTLCVMTSISIVGMVWYRSFEEDTFVMLNPDPKDQAEFFAARDARDEETQTLFAAIGSAYGNMKAAILEVTEIFNASSENKKEDKAELKTLPISGDR